MDLGLLRKRCMDVLYTEPYITVHLYRKVSTTGRMRIIPKPGAPSGRVVGEFGGKQALVEFNVKELLEWLDKEQK